MPITKTIIVASYAVFLGSAMTSSAVAQDAGARKVEQYTCKDVMRENGSARDTAIAFLHGFLLGKTGVDGFDLEALTKQTDAFIDHCLDNPAQKALDAMMKVKS